MLIAENITKKYKQPVLRGVSLTADGGEIVGIAGENGSGKSTLLSVLTTVVKPDGGRVTVEGEDVFRDPRALRRWIGYVPQDYALFDHLSARDNLKLWTAAYGADWRNALPFLFPRDTAGTADFSHTADTSNAEQKQFLMKKAGLLSGGMKKRLSIALALAHEPRYLIMDEPSAGLDIGFKWALTDLIRTVKARGGCVIFTSHHPEELLLCDRIYVLREGLFVYAGDPKDLVSVGSMQDALFTLIKGKGAEKGTVDHAAVV